MRVYLPDLWVLQASFRPRESRKLGAILLQISKSPPPYLPSSLPPHGLVKALVKFIRENLAQPETKFQLCELYIVLVT